MSPKALSTSTEKSWREAWEWVAQANCLRRFSGFSQAMWTKPKYNRQVLKTKDVHFLKPLCSISRWRLNTRKPRRQLCQRTTRTCNPIAAHSVRTFRSPTQNSQTFTHFPSGQLHILSSFRWVYFCLNTLPKVLLWSHFLLSRLK